MRVVERTELEEHFSEGEPDLEPPEELAVAEVDEDTLLEEDLDSEIVLEQDVDEDTLEVTLEDLVHLDDEEDEEAVQLVGSTTEPGEADEGEEPDDDALDMADVQESLDRILRERLATADSAEDDVDDSDAIAVRADGALPNGRTTDAVLVEPCGVDEFVCRGCFLVRNRVQLADAADMRCRDCAS